MTITQERMDRLPLFHRIISVTLQGWTSVLYLAANERARNSQGKNS
jgi:hypothetical protein